ncbi:VWA domain-containing protein [Actinocorallia populi]|uniref:VWA domain-containing protein n=1 Tax=Actinocorallia populi TaxID=2079200 RepID=UPI000D092D51|nr:VWA domain-containing protein [Actinocorallia populi]
MRKALITALAALLLAGGCSTPDSSGGEGALRILAGSELADLAPILREARAETGVSVELDYTGTIEGVEQVVSGQAARGHDAVWFSSNRYLELHQNVRTGTATPVMSSPVVLGVRPEAARRLGWDSARPTWKQVAEAAARREFTYGMTDPASSNSGFSALVGVSIALNGGSDLDPAGIEKISGDLRKFFSAQLLTAGSSGWLSESFVRNGAEVDGLVNYESVLRSLNASGQLAEPLVLVYPADGVATADYPLTLLGSASQEARERYGKLTAYLLKPEVQQRIAQVTHRRPVTAGTGGAGPSDLKELPFPGAPDTVDRLVAAFFDRLRRPSRTVYVLDVSGSMRGNRLDDLKTALVSLTGADDGFHRFHNREEVTMLPFSGKPQQPRRFTVPDDMPGPVLQQIQQFSEGLNAGGGTAIYDSLAAAYEATKQQVADDPDRFTSIVLMSDGENTQGMDYSDFVSRYRDGLAVPGVPVFPVLFGEAEEDEMNDLASLTGGRAFDARKQSLATVFKEIRGYQ